MAMEADPAGRPGDRRLADQPGGGRRPCALRAGRAPPAAAAVGYILLAILQFIALARYPHQFHWGSASGTVYLIFLAAMLLTGTAGLARGQSHPGR